jgi:RNA polymerase sigma-70 factor (ECF subfamily)
LHSQQIAESDFIDSCANNDWSVTIRIRISRFLGAARVARVQSITPSIHTLPGKKTRSTETVFMGITPSTSAAGPSQSEGSSRVDWAAVLAQNERWLRTVVYSRVGEAQAVDDVMQEVSLAAVEQRAPVADPNKVPAWLYRVAVTQSLLYRRKLGRQRKLTNNYARGSAQARADASELDPLRWLLADERQQLVRTALLRLRKRDVEILLLKYTEGWNYRQLAEHLGISHGAVQARLHRARQRLRRELATLSVFETE